MEIATVSFDTRHSMLPRIAVLILEAVVFSVAIAALLQTNRPMPITIIVASIGLLAIVGTCRFAFRRPPDFTYLRIDSEGIHFRKVASDSEELISWERVRAVKTKYDDGFIGIELQVSAPVGWS